MTLENGLKLLAAPLLALTLGLASGCSENAATAEAADGGAAPRHASGHLLPAGTPMNVTLGREISSESASLLDSWRGTLAADVVTANGGIIPAGSTVTGVIADVASARRGSRASLELEVRGIRVNGRDESVTAETDAVVAGSPRARNLGAVAGGAVAGALLGKVVGDGRNSAVGGLLGGAAAAGVVAGSKGYQVVLHAGTVVEFTVSQTVALR
jgi:hypothetical protein